LVTSDKARRADTTGRCVAAHRRSHVKGAFTTQTEHRPSAHRAHAEWTPSRILDWAGKVGAATRDLCEAILADRPHPEQGFRSCLGILRLGKRYGEPAQRRHAPGCGLGPVGRELVGQGPALIGNGGAPVKARPRPLTHVTGGSSSSSSPSRAPAYCSGPPASATHAPLDGPVALGQLRRAAQGTAWRAPSGSVARRRVT
jgi:hypothetical protein